MLVWLKLILCVLAILIFGSRLARYGDIIAERTGLGRVWIGLLLLALVTSLPELFNGISAVTLIDAPDLTIGDLFGANTFNLLNLAVLDIFFHTGFFTSSTSKNHVVTAWFSLAMVAIPGMAILVNHWFATPAFGWIGWYTPLLIVAYFFFMRRLFRLEQRRTAPPSLKGRTIVDHEKLSLKRIYLYFAISAVFVIGAGIWLATVGQEIARVTGLEESVVGTLFLAFTTSLPEITVAFSAMKIGAADMAIANMMGSNLFNMTIIAIDDIFYAKGPVLSYVAGTNLITVLTVILMTVAFIIASVYPPKRFTHFSWWNVTTTMLFLLGAYLHFISR